MRPAVPRHRSSRIATASAAFCSRLVSAWRSIRRSHGATGPRSGMSVSPGDLAGARSSAAPAPRARCGRHPRLDHRLRHAGKGGELIDHAADVADMADDGVGALREGLGIGGDLPREAPLQPFGGELDRRQRVLDLVRDAARHIGPGRLALRRLQLGDVVEGHARSRRAPRHPDSLARRSAPAACAGCVGGPIWISAVCAPLRSAPPPRRDAARRTPAPRRASGWPIAASRSMPEQFVRRAVRQLDAALRHRARSRRPRRRTAPSR